MAKRKVTRQPSKPSKGSVFLFAFILVYYIIYQIGFTTSPPSQEELPTNDQEREVISYGIDISEWNEDVDYKGLKNEGVSFAIIRCSHGIEGKIDPMFETHQSGAKKAGLKIGAYHYSKATTISQALDEADTVLSVLNSPYYYDYPIFYDIETPDQNYLSSTELTEIVLAFLERIESKGYKAGLYASESWLEDRLNMDELEEYDIWIASYTDHLNYDGKYDIWQYSEDGYFDDIAGKYDLNICYKLY